MINLETFQLVALYVTGVGLYQSYAVIIKGEKLSPT